MPETMTAAELLGTQTQTSEELFGSDTVDPAKTSGEIPIGDIAPQKPSYKTMYEDILNGNLEWDSYIPPEKRAVLRQVDSQYNENGKRVVNAAYLSDLTGMDYDTTYIAHDQLSQTLLKEKTPSKAFDRIKNRFNNGRVQVQIMDLGYAALTGKIDNAEALEQINRLQTQLTSDSKEDLRWFGEQMLGATAEQLPNIWEAIKVAPIGAGGGGVVGALVAGIAGQLGPQAATPEEAVTIPAAASFGAKVGGGVAAANRIRELEAGGMYIELLEMKDDNGKPVDPAIAATTAHIVGVINGGLELTEWAVILETFGIGTKVFEKAATKATSKIAAQGTLKHLALKYSMKYGASLSAEVLQELSQESTNIVMGELAKSLNNESKGTGFKPITKDQLVDRYYEIASESLKGFALLVAPGTMFSAIKEAIVGEKIGVKQTETKEATPETLVKPIEKKEQEVVKPAEEINGLTPLTLPETEEIKTKTEPVATDKAVGAVFETPEADVAETVSKETELTTEEATDLKKLDDVSVEKIEAAKQSKRKPSVKIREFLSPGSTVEKVIKESVALKAAMKKAAQAARKAFATGKTEGIAKIKAHYAELKAREKQRNVLKSRIQKAVKVIKKQPPKTVDLFYRRAIEAIQDSIDPAYRTEKTKQKRQRMREFLERATPEQKKAFPAKLAKMLDKKTLAEFTVEELESVAAEIKNLTKMGKTKSKAKASIEKSQLEKEVDALTDVSGKAPAIDRETANTGDYSRTGIIEGLKNGYLWTLRLPRIFDWLDGRKGTFSGLWHRTFYDRVNEQYNSELRVSEKRHKSGTEKMNELGITMNELAEVDDFSELQNGLSLTKEQQMGLYAAMKNILSQDAVFHGNRIKQKTANAILSNLDQKYKELADFIIDEYQQNYERIREVYEAVTGEDLGKEINYTPIVRLEISEYAAKSELIDQLLERHNLKRGYVEKKFTLYRKNIAPEHQKPMDLRLVSLWQSQVQKQEHFIHFEQLTKNLRKILANNDIKASIEQKLGSQGIKIINAYVDRVANPTIYKAYDGLAGVSRILRRNVAMAYLSYNLMTIAKQVPSLVLYTKDSGVSSMLSSVSEFAKNSREVWDRVRDKDPQVKNAFIEREIEDLRNALSQTQDKDTIDKINRLISQVGHKGMIGIRFVDGIVRTIGWNAVYQKNRQLGLSEAESARLAQNATLRTQPASAAKDIANLYANNEFLNWFTMFTNQLNNVWNITTYDTFAYWSDKKYQNSAMTLMGVAANALWFWMLVNKKLPEDEDDLIDAGLDQILNILPLINSGAMAGKRGWGTLTPPPIKAVEETAKMLSAKDKKKQAIKAIESSLVLTGVPVAAIKRGYRTLETGDPMQLLGGQKKSKGMKL